MKNKVRNVLAALVLCMSAVVLPVTAYASTGSDTTPPTLTAALTDDKLAVEASDDMSGVEAVYVDDTRINSLVNGKGTVALKDYAGDGKKVTVVDQLPVEQFAKDHSPAPRGMLLQLLETYGVELVGGVRVCGINDDGVVVMAQDGTKSVIRCDDVVAAFGMRKNDALLKQLRALMPDVVAVGDCDVVKNIKNANQIAFNMALEV